MHDIIEIYFKGKSPVVASHIMIWSEVARNNRGLETAILLHLLQCEPCANFLSDSPLPSFRSPPHASRIAFKALNFTNCDNNCWLLLRCPTLSIIKLRRQFEPKYFSKSFIDAAFAIKIYKCRKRKVNSVNVDATEDIQAINNLTLPGKMFWNNCKSLSILFSVFFLCIYRRWTLHLHCKSCFLKNVRDTWH